MRGQIAKDSATSSNYFAINKKLNYVLGCTTTVFLTCLLEGERYLKSKNAIDSDGWFYQTAPTIESLTGIKKHKQATCIEKLIAYKILEQDNRGMPMKRYFRILGDGIADILEKNTREFIPEQYLIEYSPYGTPRSDQNGNQAVTNGDTNRTITYNTIIDKDSFNKLKEEDKSSVELPLEDLIEKEVLPINKNKLIPTKDYKLITSLLNKWKERSAGVLGWGSSHKLAPANNEQSGTVMAIYKGFTEASNDLLAFYDKHSPRFYPVWVSAHNINRESIVKALEKNSSKELVAKALRSHLNVLHSGSTKEGGWEISNSLQAFFMIKRAKAGNLDKTSWLLYWLCKEDSEAIKEAKRLANNKPPQKLFADLGHKYYNYRNLYTKFSELFPNENIITLTESYITTFAKAKDYRDIGHIKLFTIFDRILKPIIEYDKTWMDVCKPNRYLPGSASWKAFILKVKESNMYTKIEIETYEKANNINISEKGTL